MTDVVNHLCSGRLTRLGSQDRVLANYKFCIFFLGFTYIANYVPTSKTKYSTMTLLRNLQYIILFLVKLA